MQIYRHTVCHFIRGNNLSLSRKEKKTKQDSSICVTLICECESLSTVGTSAPPADEPTGSRQTERERETCGTHQGILAYRHAAASSVLLNVL